MFTDLLSKVFNLRSKWLTILLIALLVGLVFVIGYLKFYSIDSHNDLLDQLYNENKLIKTECQKLDTAYKSLTSNISSLQTQMTHGVLLDSIPKGKLQLKSNQEGSTPLANVSSLPVVNKVATQSQSQPKLLKEESTEQQNKDLNAQIDADIESMLGESENESDNRDFNTGQIIIVDEDSTEGETPESVQALEQENLKKAQIQQQEQAQRQLQQKRQQQQQLQQQQLQQQQLQQQQLQRQQLQQQQLQQQQLQQQQLQQQQLHQYENQQQEHEHQQNIGDEESEINSSLLDLHEFQEELQADNQQLEEFDEDDYEDEEENDDKDIPELSDADLQLTLNRVESPVQRPSSQMSQMSQMSQSQINEAVSGMNAKEQSPMLLIEAKEVEKAPIKKKMVLNLKKP